MPAFSSLDAGNFMVLGWKVDLGRKKWAPMMPMILDIRGWLWATINIFSVVMGQLRALCAWSGCDELHVDVVAHPWNRVRGWDHSWTASISWHLDIYIYISYFKIEKFQQIDSIPVYNSAQLNLLLLQSSQPFASLQSLAYTHPPKSMKHPGILELLHSLPASFSPRCFCQIGDFLRCTAAVHSRGGVGEDGFASTEADEWLDFCGGLDNLLNWCSTF